MKRIIALALFGIVAMLSVPTVIADRGGIPNENVFNNPTITPAWLVSETIMFYGLEPDGPGFSEVGQLMIDYNTVDNLNGLSKIGFPGPNSE